MSQTQDSIGLTEEGLKKVQQRMSQLEKPDNPDRKGWSQPDLVKMSYTSESTVKRFLKRTPISRQCFIGIARALGIEAEEIADPKAWNRTTGNPELNQSSDIDWQEVCRAMLKPKRELASNLFTSGMGITFELDDIHVPLGLVERPQKAQRRDDSSPEEGSRVYREEKEKITPIDYNDFFQQVLANQQSPKSNGKRLNIIGEPGAGKTTQLLKIADWVLDETEDLPIWISLGVVGEKPLQEYLLKDWLRDAAGKLDAAPPEWVEQLEQHLKDGRVWLLLDGADEMQAADPLGKLAEFVRVPLLKNVRVVLTCRLNLWDAAGNALSEFDTYKMLDFSYGDGKNPDQVKQFIDKWFGNPSLQEAYPCIGGTEGGQQLRKALDETGKERIKDLARHPLRLALLCFTWQSGRGKLPDTKAELYEMFVKALYVLKKGVFPTTSAQQRDLNTALGRLALKAIDKGFKSILPYSLVYEELEKPHPELFELADKLGWLNRVGDEPENPLKSVYAFFHPTFQEYFTATVIDDWDFFLPRDHKDRPVKDKDNSGEYRQYRVFEPQWKEVILLWLGRQEEKLKSKHKEDLIKELVDFDDGIEHIFYGFQAYFLAAVGIREFPKYEGADEIVENLINWSFGEYLESIVKEAKVALRETDINQAINILSKQLPTDKEAWSDAFLIAQILGQSSTGNVKAIEALIQLLISHHKSWYSLYKTDPASESLVRIGYKNQYAIRRLKELLLDTDNPCLSLRLILVLEKITEDEKLFINDTLKKLTTSDVSEYIRLQAARKIIKINPNISSTLPVLVKRKKSYYNKDKNENRFNLNHAIELFTSASEFINAIAAFREPQVNQQLASEAQQLWKKIQNNLRTDDEDVILDNINLLIKLLLNCRDSSFLSRVISSLVEIADKHPRVKNAIIKTVYIEKDEYWYESVALFLEKNSSINEKDVKILVHLIITSKHMLARKQAVKSLKIILRDKLWSITVTSLKDCLTEQIYKNNFELYAACYEVIWYCAKNMPYPEFYQAWHSENSILSAEAQALESQNLDFNPLQPTDYSQ